MSQITNTGLLNRNKGPVDARLEIEVKGYWYQTYSDAVEIGVIAHALRAVPSEIPSAWAIAR